MGWFEEQIKMRSEADDQALDDALKNVSGMIEGKKHRSFRNNKEEIKSVLDEILSYFHVVPHDIPPELDELEDQMDYLFRPYGILYRKVRLEKGWQHDASGVYLGKRITGEIVALVPDLFGRYSFFDPVNQRKVIVNKKTQNLLEEEAYCFYKPFPLKEIGIKDLLKFIVSSIHVSTFVQVVAITLFGTLVGMLTPKLTKLLFSQVLDSKNLQLLFAVIAFYFCVSLSALLIKGIKALMMSRISTELDVSVEAATMARVLSLSTDFFKNYSSGEITSKASSIRSLCTTLVQTIFSTGLTSLFSLLYLSQVFVYAKELVIPAVCITLITIAFSIISSLVQMRISRRQMELSGKLDGTTYQLLTGIEKIKLSGSEKRVFARWLNQYTEESRLTYDPPKFLLFHGVISNAISLFGTIVMYYFAVSSNVSVADYTAFNSAYGMLSGALLSVSGIALTTAKIKPILEMAKPILNAKPEVSEGKKFVTKISGSIELSHVSFRYSENTPPVLDDLSLKINPGQYVAIVGKTGCGKSTLLRLLLGFEKPQKGVIYYDRKNLDKIDPVSLRKKIGVVMQNGKLFQGDIYSNIVISAPYLSVEDAWRAAEIADIADDIRKLPMGMHTIISEGNGGISGGQKQRLMIARAVAPNPRILMFDEATSALDNITQKKVSDALGELKCTRIVIAHRLSTIKQCDRILVLDKGKIIEDGTYEELLQQKGFFYELVQRQRLDDGR